MYPKYPKEIGLVLVTLTYNIDMERDLLYQMAIGELRENAKRLMLAVDELDFCLVSVEEERDELRATKEMLEAAYSFLKPVSFEAKPKKKAWKDAIQEVLDDKPQVTDKYDDLEERKSSDGSELMEPTIKQRGAFVKEKAPKPSDMRKKRKHK